MQIEYDHTKLSIEALHKVGIRSTSDLEQVIEWPDSVCVKDSITLGFDIYIITGLTENCKGLSVALTVSEKGKFITLDAEIPSRDELIHLLIK